MSDYLFPILVVIQVISSIAIIGLVLLQQGKGADMGSSFGGGSAGSLFGAAGSANFFSRMTKWAAIVFFTTTLGLAWVSSGGGVRAPKPTDSGSLMEGYSATPVIPGAATVSGDGSATQSVPTVPQVKTEGSVKSNEDSNSSKDSKPFSESKPVEENKPTPAPAVEKPVIEISPTVEPKPEPASKPEVAPQSQNGSQVSSSSNTKQESNSENPPAPVQ